MLKTRLASSILVRNAPMLTPPLVEITPALANAGCQN